MEKGVDGISQMVVEHAARLLMEQNKQEIERAIANVKRTETEKQARRRRYWAARREREAYLARVRRWRSMEQEHRKQQKLRKMVKHMVEEAVEDHERKSKLPKIMM